MENVWGNTVKTIHLFQRNIFFHRRWKVRCFFLRIYSLYYLKENQGKLWRTGYGSLTIVSNFFFINGCTLFTVFLDFYYSYYPFIAELIFWRTEVLVEKNAFNNFICRITDKFHHWGKRYSIYEIAFSILHNASAKQKKFLPKVIKWWRMFNIAIVITENGGEESAERLV